jgi:hypothetical protein
MNTREHATVLAALRYWQRIISSYPYGDGSLPSPEEDVATNGGDVEALGSEEIDDLCERINQ